MPMPSNSVMSPLALVGPQFNADSTSLRVILPFSWATSTIFARSWERASCGAGTDGWAELEEAGVWFVSEGELSLGAATAFGAFCFQLAILAQCFHGGVSHVAPSHS